MYLKKKNKDTQKYVVYYTYMLDIKLKGNNALQKTKKTIKKKSDHRFVFQRKIFLCVT